MTDDRTSAEGTGKPDDTVVQPALRIVREEPVVVPPLAAGATPGSVHEEERVRVGPDGSLVREFDRVDQPPVDRGRNWWPWAISAVLLLVLIGLAIWYFTRDQKTTVTPVLGQASTAAVTRLQEDGFKTQVIRRVSTRRAGTVVGEQPAGGSKAAKRSLVVLTVAAASSSVAVPNAVGIAQGEARDRLVSAGFTVKSVPVYSSQPTGTVVAQAPAAGEKITRGTAIRINVSKGSATANVPSEVGQTSDAAQHDLAAKGFKASIVQVPSDQPTGTVVAQSPSGGQSRKGTNVQLNVSKGAPATTAAATTTVTTSAATATTPSTGSETTSTTG